MWTRLKAEAARQDRTIFETSSMMGLSAIRGVPDSLRWLSASAQVSAMRTGQVLGSGLLDYYRQTLDHIREVGFARYAVRQFRPYVRAAVSQFSPSRRTLTERLLERFAFPERSRGGRPRG